MCSQQIVIIGRVDAQCILIGQRDLPLVVLDKDFRRIKCVVLDLISGKISHLVTLKQINEVCPFKAVTSENEAEVLMDIVEELIPKGKMEIIERILLENNS